MQQLDHSKSWFLLLIFGTEQTPSITDENWYLHRISVKRERVLSNRIRCSSSGKLSIPEVDQMERKKKLSYLLRTKNADKSVRVIVEKKNSKYLVHLEVSSAGLVDAVEGALVMSWGIQRSVYSSPIPLDSQSSTQKPKTTTYEAPFVLTAVGTYAAELEFDSHLAPFYLSFVLKHVGSTGIDEFNHLGRNFCVPVGFGSGSPSSLGSTLSSDGSTNFALFSRNADSVVLCLFDDHKSEKPALEIELDPYVNRTGNIWHVSINAQGRYVAYGYRCKGPRVRLIRC